MPASDAEPTRRKRGRPPRIDQAKIIAAAREVSPKSLTIQAVADRLGVHRNAVHYYVSDRDGLLNLLASDAVNNGPAEYLGYDSPTWQGAVIALGTWARDNYLAAGELLSFYRFESRQDVNHLEPSEHLLTRLFEAGFTGEQAARTLVMTLTLALGYARDVALAEGSDRHPQMQEIAEAIADNHDLPAIRSLVSEDFSQMDAAQFQFDLEILVKGLETLLD